MTETQELRGVVGAALIARKPAARSCALSFWALPKAERRLAASVSVAI